MRPAPTVRQHVHRIIVASAFVVAIATTMRAAPAQNSMHGCVDHFDAAVDYFPDKVAIEDATNFTVDYRKSYKVITVKVPYPGGVAERYVLPQCGTPTPALTGSLAGAQVIPVPIASLFSASTTHIPLLVDLKRVDVLTGVSQLAYIEEPEVLTRIRAGRVVEFSGAGQNIDVERIVAARPAVFMSSGAMSPSFAVIQGAGIPIVSNSEWLEPTGLARAEWIKFMAVLLNEERQAQTVYGAMKHRYADTTRRATSSPSSTWPAIMTGRSTRGVFVIAGGRSYVAQFIKDAGGRYVWAENTAIGSPSVDLETQVRRAANADIWINGGGWKDRAAMLQDEPRYAEFKAFRTGQVWVYERRERPNGANDYWTRSVSRPDLVLLDLVKIFHPTLATDRDFEWYMKVPGM
jgi:iron complex transport system substrate-binding protein